MKISLTSAQHAVFAPWIKGERATDIARKLGRAEQSVHVMLMRLARYNGFKGVVDLRKSVTPGSGVALVQISPAVSDVGPLHEQQYLVTDETTARMVEKCHSTIERNRRRLEKLAKV